MKALIALLAFLALSSPVWGAEGYATYYTTKSCQKEGNSGVYTASGERFDEGKLTCALRLRSWGRTWAIYGHETGRTVFVRNNDYGPGKGPSRRGVIVDLTPEAFRGVCGDLSKGKCKVSVQEVI